MDRGAWQVAFHRVAQSQTWLKQLSMRACMKLKNKEYMTKTLCSPQCYVLRCLFVSNSLQPLRL